MSASGRRSTARSTGRRPVASAGREDLPTRPVPYPRYDGTQPCVEIGPDGMHPYGSDHVQVAAAKSVCGPCRFVDACKEFAVSYNVQGVWGGTSYADRRRERQRLGISAIPITLTDASHTRRQLAELDDGVTNSEIIAQLVGCSAKTVQRYRQERKVAA